MTGSARSDARIPGQTGQSRGAYGPQRSRVPAARAASAGEPRGVPGRKSRMPAVTGPFLRVVLVAPAAEFGVDRSGVSSDNPAMDPVIAALAQLVRDRYERERADKAARRGRLRVVEGR